MNNDVIIDVDCEFINAARRRADEMHLAGRQPLEPPSLQDFSHMLGEDAVSCTLLGENWRNRVYRVQFASGRAAVAKQLVLATDAMLQRQYEQHVELASLRLPKLSVPEPLAILPAKRTYLMEVAGGKTIEALVWKGAKKDLLDGCAAAGDILARIQVAQGQQTRLLPVDALQRDFAAAPWHLSKRYRQTLATALQKLAPAEISVGRLYYDYKPANTLFDQGILHLIDPPDTLREGIHLWDVALFRSSMRRHLWRFSLRHPLGRERRTTILAAIRAFQESYVAALPSQGDSFNAIVWLLELQRTAVLITMQQGKVAATSKTEGAGAAQMLGHPLANRLSLTLLDIEKQWLFQRLARELKRIAT